MEGGNGEGWSNREDVEITVEYNGIRIEFRSDVMIVL